MATPAQMCWRTVTSRVGVVAAIVAAAAAQQDLTHDEDVERLTSFVYAISVIITILLTIMICSIFMQHLLK